MLVGLLLIELSPYLPEHLYEQQRLGSTAGRVQGLPGKLPTAQAVLEYAAQMSSSPSTSTPTPHARICTNRIPGYPATIAPIQATPEHSFPCQEAAEICKE